MKGKLKAVSLISAIVLSFFFSGMGVHAQDSDYSAVERNGESVIVDQNGYVHELYDRNGNKIETEEALQILNSTESNYTTGEGTERRTVLRAPAGPYCVSLSGHTSYYGNKVRVTPWFVGPATITYGESHTVSESFGGSVSISASIKAGIIAQASAQFDINWFHSASSSRSFSGSFTVPGGKRGAVYFMPRIIRVTGYYYDGQMTSHYVYGDTPAKIGDFADGIYDLVTQS